ncbi:MAG: hypothetical protein N4A45_04750 [Flavobacteriales bacterium]|nr:hypothetical protein [Flavobacteriales bacterium]
MEIRLITLLLGISFISCNNPIGTQIKDHGEKSFNGVVKRLYYDKMDHGAFKAILQDGNEVVYVTKDIYDALKVSDSIEKHSGDYHVYQFRNDSLINVFFYNEMNSYMPLDTNARNAHFWLERYKQSKR